MKKFSIYQLRGPENRDTRFDVQFGENPAEIAINAFKENRYTFVAEIKAVDLNHCFEVGNIGPEENITRRRSMASLSVGDVLIDWKTGEQHLIKNIGFEKLNIAA